jgi:hypothetical protein
MWEGWADIGADLVRVGMGVNLGFTLASWASFLGFWAKTAGPFCMAMRACRHRSGGKACLLMHVLMHILMRITNAYTNVWARVETNTAGME